MGGDGSNLNVKVVSYCINPWCRARFLTNARHRGKSRCPVCSVIRYKEQKKINDRDRAPRKYRGINPQPSGGRSRFTEAQFNEIRQAIDALNGHRIPRTLLRKYGISPDYARVIKKGWRPKRFRRV